VVQASRLRLNGGRRNAQWHLSSMENRRKSLFIQQLSNHVNDQSTVVVFLVLLFVVIGSLSA
jgi:uncharacterized protein Veg